jgi:hypothetical protein
VIGFVSFAMHVGKKHEKKVKGDLNNLKKAIKEKMDNIDSKRESIIARLKQAQAITDQQLSLRASQEEPSKNALHSKYKNGLNGEIKKLEEEVKNFKGDHIKTLEKKTQLQSTKYSHQLKTETNNKLLNYIKNAENEIEKNFQKALEHRSKSLEDLIKNKLDEKFKEKYKQSIEDTFLLHIKKTKDIQKNFIKDTIKRID